MFDWFDEPIVYYRRFAPMRSGVFDYMSRWMDSVDRAMEEEFGDFYDSFTRRRRPARYNVMIEDDADDNEAECKKCKKDKNGKKNAKDAKDAKNAKNAKADMKEAKAEEKNDEEKVESSDDDDSVPQYYSFTSSMYSGSDGVQHIYREEVDSKSGLRKVVDTKRIGNKSLTVHEVTDKDGNVEKHETAKNLHDDEIEDFKNQWASHNVPKQSSLPEPEEDANKKTDDKKVQDKKEENKEEKKVNDKKKQ